MSSEPASSLQPLAVTEATGPGAYTLVHFSMRQDTFSAYRSRLVPAAQGRVLEIGAGSGVNLPLYADAATWARARQALSGRDTVW